MTIIKDGDSYFVLVNGDCRIMLARHTFGTHGNSSGWDTYKRIDEKWVYAGIDRRVAGYQIDDPPHFNSIKQARDYYSAMEVAHES